MGHPIKFLCVLDDLHVAEQEKQDLNNSRDSQYNHGLFRVHVPLLCRDPRALLEGHFIPTGISEKVNTCFPDFVGSILSTISFSIDTSPNIFLILPVSVSSIALSNPFPGTILRT